MSDEKTKLTEETEVFYCANGEWADLDDGSYSSCGVFCGPALFGDLPEYMQAELREEYES